MYLGEKTVALKEAIYKRKSTRKYQSVALEEHVLQDIEDYLAKLVSLYPDIAVSFRIVGQENVNSWTLVKAPYYVVVSSEKKKGHFVNVGFMLQQVDLYLSSIGLGSCWLGMGKPTVGVDVDKDYVIMLAFGKAIGSPYREFVKFKRKSLNEISDRVDDERFEVVRLAPSARNKQNYYLTTSDDVIRVYCGEAGFITKKFFTKLFEIDVGIVLAHLFVANRETFRFFEDESSKEVKGYYYVGSVNI